MNDTQLRRALTDGLERWDRAVTAITTSGHGTCPAGDGNAGKAAMVAAAVEAGAAPANTDQADASWFRQMAGSGPSDAQATSPPATPTPPCRKDPTR